MEKHHSKWHTYVPQPSLQCYFQYSRYRSKKKSIDRLNLQEMWYIYTMGYYSDIKNHPWNYKIMPIFPTRMDLQRSYAKWSQQQWIADDVLSRKKKIQGKQITAWKETLRFKHKGISDLDNPQGLTPSFFPLPSCHAHIHRNIFLQIYKEICYL